MNFPTTKVTQLFHGIAGSCKIERNCTATMTVSILPDGSVKADAILTHYGHHKELQHTRVTKRKRQEIAAKLKQGVSRERIIDDIRESVSGKLGRHHLMARRDIANIEQAYGLRDVQRHANDQQSVLAWIEEWKQTEENPILYYKLQGQEAEEGFDLSKDDFFIVIQSRIQRQMFQKFASKGVCCDSTHGTNAYDFSLTTILVIDEFGQGLPAGWCLSSHEDFTTMTIFFKEIKKNCGLVNSKFFMSDMAPQFYNAWVAVMGDPRPAKLLCTWHVDKAWKEELRRKIGDMTVEAEVYKMLRIVLQQTQEAMFKDCLDGLLQRLKTGSKCAEFYAYFSKEWVHRKEQWAYCYRCGLQINTNMFVEAFHRVFKRLYLKGKVNKRVDNCLVNLMKYSRDMGFDRLIKMTKGKLTYRAHMISERHVQSLHLPLEFSIHSFLCTCPDSLIMSTICKHIHLVKRSAAQDGTDEFLNDKDQSSDNDGQQQEIEHILASIRSRPDDITSLKTRVKGTILQIMEEVDQCTSSSALKQLDKQMTAAASLLASLKSDKEQEVIPLKANENAPANKNMETQPRFYSTKKRCRKAKVRLTCPTYEEQQAFLKDIDENRGKNTNLRIAEGKCHSVHMDTFHTLLNIVDGF